MKDNYKQDHLGKNKFGCTLFAELRDRDTRALPRIFRLFWIPHLSSSGWQHNLSFPVKTTCVSHPVS